MNQKKYKKTWHLIWTLAITDFRLRYHGAILGFLWSLLQPLLMFTVMFVVFSSIFRTQGTNSEYYALELLTSLTVFMFFSQGTMSGLSSFVDKQSILTKIATPLWTVILSSSMNTFLIFLTNIFIIILFFAFSSFIPSISAIAFFFFSLIQMIFLIVSFSFFAAPLYVRFRDITMIWEVITRILMYASPIIYPLSMMPADVQKILLLNPLAFIIHFQKEALIYNHFPTFFQSALFSVSILGVFLCSLLFYKKYSKNIIELL